MTRIWKLFRFSWKDTQKLRITQQTIRSTMSYIKDFLTKWPIKIAAKIEIASNIRIFPTQILIYWCLDLKKNQTAIQNLNFHFWGFGVNFFMMAITLTLGLVFFEILAIASWATAGSWLYKRSPPGLRGNVWDCTLLVCPAATTTVTVEEPRVAPQGFFFSPPYGGEVLFKLPPRVSKSGGEFPPRVPKYGGK